MLPTPSCTSPVLSQQNQTRVPTEQGMLQPSTFLLAKCRRSVGFYQFPGAECSHAVALGAWTDAYTTVRCVTRLLCCHGALHGPLSHPAAA